MCHYTVTWSHSTPRRPGTYCFPGKINVAKEGEKRYMVDVWQSPTALEMAIACVG
jgi:hypothetical protein